MDMKKIRRLVAQYWIPGLVALLGLILTVNPDSAAVLASKLVGLVLIAQGIVMGLNTARMRSTAVPTGRWIVVGASIALGLILGRNPMLMARMIFRFLGVVLLVRSVADLQQTKNMGAEVKTVTIITLVCGAVLTLVPVGIYRLVGRVLGIVVLAIGVMNIVSRYRSNKFLNPGDDGDKPGIIDV